MGMVIVRETQTGWALTVDGTPWGEYRSEEALEEALDTRASGRDIHHVDEAGESLYPHPNEREATA